MKKASFKNKEKVVAILSATFITETFPNSINFVVKQDHKREKRIRRLMKYQVNMALTFGDIFLSDNEKSCVLFLDSERKKTNLKTLLWEIELAIWCTGFRNAFRVLKREKILAKYHPKHPFLHLWIMGTSPSYKNKGLGTILLNEVLHFYGSSKPIYLETTTKSNRDFYTKLGFKIFHETHILNYPLYFLLKSKNQ